ncbi:ATP-binding protein [Phascolarctobacterium sp.]|uniref:ATP-binding protein n=2 Tax=Phascolarctobacterium sp. TaxID=2049039 RepID=UPI00386A1624
MHESHNIEWKQKWKDEYLEWICCFANAQGGKLYIGFDDDGNVVGVQNAHKLLEDLPNKIRDAMGIVVGINLIKDHGKEYIEIDVPQYPIGISCKGVYYYRSGSTKQVLSGPALETFLLQKRGVTWDNLPLPAFTIDDIDENTLRRFKELALKKGRIEPELLDESNKVLMEKLHLLNNGYLTNAAMLLFAKDPERWQLGAYTKIGFFETNADLLYQDEVRGSLIEQVDKIIKLLNYKYMKALISYDGMHRVERYFVPEAALREAILNALCHKRYESGIPVQISVYEDKIYIVNVGELPAEWTMENLLKKHASRPYNPNVAHGMYLAGFIESWGRGVEKIIEACDAFNTPYPQYKIGGGDVMVKFAARSDWPFRVNVQVNVRVNDNVNDGERAVLNKLIEDPGYTVSVLSEQLKLSRKTIAAKLKALKEKNLIERIGTARKGYWKVKK